MTRPGTETLIKLVALVPFLLACAAVVVAVLGKAYRDFPYRPDEGKGFKRHALPRTHLLCFRYFDNHRPAPKRRAGKTTHEDTDSQRPRRDRG